MSTSVIRGVIGYTITPFTADGTLDLDALGTSIDSLIADGVHAIAPMGSTGEGAYLSDSEWETVVRFSQARIADRVPSVVSVSDLTTARTVQRARLAQACGATAVMVLPISYWKLTEAEVIAHYKAVGAAIDIPIMLYNNPGTSGTDLSVELILRILGEVPNVTMVTTAATPMMMPSVVRKLRSLCRLIARKARMMVVPSIMRLLLRPPVRPARP